MDNGALVISLDFELLWGVFDKIDISKKKEYFENTRKLIPSLLHLFESYEINCTWATVGMLFNKDWDEWNVNIPEFLPHYENEKLSPYKYGGRIQSRQTEKLCFAPDLIEQIRNTEGQELATHTYSHYYCLEPGQDAQAFQSDLHKASELASKFNLELTSLVFPRNQYNATYLEICENAGIRTVRTNPENWYWRNTEKDTLAQKVFRTGDAYVGLFDKSYSAAEIKPLSSNVIGQKASRLLRPYTGKNFLDKTKMIRIHEEMENAAKNNKCYHLWWHPHNFGNSPQENLRELKSILDHFQKLKLKYNFKSLSMKEMI